MSNSPLKAELQFYFISNYKQATLNWQAVKAWIVTWRLVRCLDHLFLCKTQHRSLHQRLGTTVLIWQNINYAHNYCNIYLGLHFKHNDLKYVLQNWFKIFFLLGLQVCSQNCHVSRNFTVCRAGCDCVACNW